MGRGSHWLAGQLHLRQSIFVKLKILVMASEMRFDQHCILSANPKRIKCKCVNYDFKVGKKKKQTYIIQMRMNGSKQVVINKSIQFLG